MKLLFVFASIIVISFASPKSKLLKAHWTNFKKVHNKIYESSLDELHRLRIFKNNVMEIEAHNNLFAQGKVTYKKAINHFGDMTKSEFMEYVGKFSLKTLKIKPKYNYIFDPPIDIELPEQVDWRTKNVVTPVKDQGICGSCYSFSATGALEGQNAIVNNLFYPLSEQFLVDCSWDYGNEGCNGGSMAGSFEFAIEYGIPSAELYKYKGFSGQCVFNTSLPMLKATKFFNVKQNDEKNLQLAVASKGPISVGIVTTANFQFYDHGYFYDETCASGTPNHAVLVVGYGTEEGKDYWLVKNSWSRLWGEGGYVKMARNSNNHCAIASDASFPEL